MRLLKRLLCLAALFLCTIPLFVIESITGTADLYAALASSLLPLSMALRTFLMLVRMRERSAMLWARRFTVCFARLRADCMFAKAKNSA